jgi:hypothetical protein
MKKRITFIEGQKLCYFLNGQRKGFAKDQKFAYFWYSDPFAKIVFMMLQTFFLGMTMELIFL